MRLFFSIAFVSMILIISQSPEAFAGACPDEDRDGYYPPHAPIYCGNVDARDCDDTDPNIGTGSGCVYEESIVIEYDVNEDVEVGPGEIVVIAKGATIEGNIKIEGGTLILSHGATVKGNVKGVEGSLTITGSTVINGNLESDKGESVIIMDSTIDGNIVVKESMSVTITGNTVAGNLEIEETSGYCEDTGNDVSGNIDGCP